MSVLYKPSRIIFFNGPPSSGKDTACKYLAKTYPDKVKHEAFSKPLKQANKVLFGLDDAWFTEHDVDPVLKNKQEEELFGFSWRQVNIDLSEVFLKPHYSKGFFGKSMANRLSTDPTAQDAVVVISDSGFIEEVDELVKVFGEDCITYVRLERKGCDFSSDSRTYINIEKYPAIRKHLIINNDTVSNFIAKVEHLVWQK